MANVEEEDFTPENLNSLAQRIWRLAESSELGQAIRQLNKLFETEYRNAFERPYETQKESTTRMIAKDQYLTVQRTSSEEGGNQKLLIGSWMDSNGCNWKLRAYFELDPQSPGVYDIKIIKDGQEKLITDDQIQRSLRSI